jgi:hypothetical protein
MKSALLGWACRKLKENVVPNTKTHYPQVPLEIAKKIAEEENGPQVNEETPEQLRGPTKKVTNGKSSAQVKPEDENA